MRVMIMRVAAICAIVMVAGLVAYGVARGQRAPGAPPAAQAAPAPVNTVRVPSATPVREVPTTPPIQVAATPTPTPPAAAPAAAPTPPAPPAPTIAQASPPAPAAAPPAAPPAPTCASNPNGLGLARTVEIDTTGGPGFGFEHFKAHDFLRAGEVVLTFDDGPWPGNTPAVLAALAAHCVKATFFPIGKHATWHPEILKQVAAAGHSVGSHTWSHANLGTKSFEEGKDEIEKGISAVQWALGGRSTPYFRFPVLKHPPELVTYLGQRNIGIFSTDMDSFDFKTKRPEQVVQSVMVKLKKHGKGIILMHDFQHATALALPDLLNQLKASGYRVVHMKARDELASLPEYDAQVLKDQKLPTVSTRPTSNVVRTIEGK